MTDKNGVELCGCGAKALHYKNGYLVNNEDIPDGVKWDKDLLAFRSYTSSKVDQTNPKDLIGAKKVSISKFPLTALLHGARAMQNGAAKFGPYNWRDKKVQAGIYVDAALRHIGAWFEGEELASDSGVHHLGHAMACLAILLDAQETECLVDDRPRNGRFPEVLERLNAEVKCLTK